MLSGAGPGNVQSYKHKDILNIAISYTLQHYKYFNIINTAMNVLGSKNILKYKKQVTKFMHYITIPACSLCYNY
jgi:hypothetical protein